jgi:translation elongation factor EF-Tu-like GTPase
LLTAIKFKMYLGRRTEPDLIATITYLTKAQGGRNTPAHSKYRPQFCLPNQEQSTSGEQIFIGTDLVRPGETVQAEVTLLCPELFSTMLTVGLQFEFKEGRRTVAIGRIDKIINQTLAKKAVNIN